jgi:hypothetical protein
MGVPKHLSSDKDSLFMYHQWQANLHSMDVDEIKTDPYVPWSEPSVARLIGSIGREFLDQVFFWNVVDLDSKLEDFKQYDNGHRVHSSLDGDTPDEISGEVAPKPTDLNNFSWRRHCRELYELPIAA